MCKRKLLLQVKKGPIKAIDDELKKLEVELPARMSFGDKKEESNEDEAGYKIGEGDPHKPRQFYKDGRKYII